MRKKISLIEWLNKEPRGKGFVNKTEIIRQAVIFPKRQEIMVNYVYMKPETIIEEEAV